MLEKFAAMTSMTVPSVICDFGKVIWPPASSAPQIPNEPYVTMEWLAMLSSERSIPKMKNKKTEFSKNNIR